MDAMDGTTPGFTETSASQASNPEITCYIHSVSPVKNASSNLRKLKTLEQVKSPIKIQNYDRQKQDVLITKYTKDCTTGKRQC